MTDTRLESDIREHLIDGKLPCLLAHRMATEHGISPLDVGAAADRLDFRISCCQLGLFGYNAFGAKRTSVDVSTVPEPISAALAAAQLKEGLPCAAAWAVAAEQGVPRLLIGAIADRLELRISPCQLGCF